MFNHSLKKFKVKKKTYVKPGETDEKTALMYD